MMVQPQAMIKKTRSPSAHQDRLRKPVCFAVGIGLCLISILARNAVAVAASMSEAST